MSLWETVPFLLLAVKLILVVVTVVFCISGLDDLFIDLSYLARKTFRLLRLRREIKPLTRDTLFRSPEQRVAIMIPAWNEAGVIGRMLENTLRTIEYSSYDILVGTYPNDLATQREVTAIAERVGCVHCVVCAHDGPTCKADCLNALYQAALAIERANGVRFEIFVMQDSEDCPHRLSLKLFNYLIPRKDLVQLPVLPLPTRWSDFTAGHYIDEFAESHIKNMIVREALSRTVPSAGVGTGFSRRALDTLAHQHGRQVFNVGSLTEDYEIGFRLRRHNLKGIFVLQSLPDRIAVRAYFPSTFGAAVKQKSRWILGITLQSWRNIGWTGDFWTDYMLFRDRKSLITSLVNVLAYLSAIPVATIWVLSRVLAHSYRYPPLVREGSWLYWLIVVDTVFLGVRLFARALSVYCCYDTSQALLAIPRQVWGNFINFGAALRALWLFTASAVTGKPIAWGKTDHTFPTDSEIQSLAPALLSRVGECD
jgi:adsorption protein B